MTDRSAIGRNNKARAKGFERDVARILGGKRFLADTGGPLDVEHESLGIQVKSGGSVVTEVAATGLRSAKAGSVGKSLLPCVVLIDRRRRVGEGNRNGKYIMFDLEEFAAYHGYSGDAQEADE